jgi:hypothetical protein
MLTYDNAYKRLLPPTGGYSVAEICLNGHMTTGDAEAESEKRAKFCPECGERTVTACPDCRALLRGDHTVEGLIWPGTAENFCYNCGKPYPWTIAKRQAAKEFVAELQLDDKDREQLQGVIDDLATGGARTELAASRFKRLMQKVAKPAGSALYKIVLDLASETAKKAILGP